MSFGTPSPFSPLDRPPIFRSVSASPFVEHPTRGVAVAPAAAPAPPFFATSAPPSSDRRKDAAPAALDFDLSFPPAFGKPAQSWSPAPAKARTATQLSRIESRLDALSRLAPRAAPPYVEPHTTLRTDTMPVTVLRTLATAFVNDKSMDVELKRGGDAFQLRCSAYRSGGVCAFHVNIFSTEKAGFLVEFQRRMGDSLTFAAILREARRHLAGLLVDDDDEEEDGGMHRRRLCSPPPATFGDDAKLDDATAQTICELAQSEFVDVACEGFRALIVAASECAENRALLASHCSSLLQRTLSQSACQDLKRRAATLAALFAEDASYKCEENTLRLLLATVCSHNNSECRETRRQAALALARVAGQNRAVLKDSFHELELALSTSSDERLATSLRDVLHSVFLVENDEEQQLL